MSDDTLTFSTEDAAATFDPFAGAAVERVIPTSEAQREVWLADKLGRDASLAFNESVSLRLRGALDAGALAAALQSLVARHESLRSTLSSDGLEMLVAPPGPFELKRTDLGALDAAAREASLRRAMAQAVETPFDLETGPLLHGELVRLAAGEHVLLLTGHHIVCDGWSWGLIAEELGALYAEQLGLAPGPDAAQPYADYVAWEAVETASPAMADHERYWLDQFRGTLPVLDLPTDRPRPAVRGFASRRIDHVLDAALTAAVRKLGAGSGVSAFSVYFSAFAATLHRLTGQDDIVVGVPAAGQAASGLTGVVGHCVNLLPVRVPLDGEQPFDAFLRGTASRLLDAFDHQTLTYGTLLRKLATERDPARLPLVSVMFNIDQAAKRDGGTFPDLSATLDANPRHFENFELFVNAVTVEDGVRLECQYNTALFDAETVQRWLQAYECVLQAAVADSARAVARLPLVPAATAHALWRVQPAPTPLPSPATMHAAVVAQCAATPARAALFDLHGHLNYGELDERSNRLAHALRTRGIGRGDRVGLCLPRGNEMVVALLAVLKTGACYVPLDPGFPAARLAYYAEDAALALLVTTSAVDTAPRGWRADAAARTLELDRDTAWLSGPATPLADDGRGPQPEDAAYVIYTSGSTGQPKGVQVPHRAAGNFLASMQREPGIAADDCLAAVTTLSFDIAVLELLLPLTVGARVVVVPREAAMDSALLAGLLESTGASMMQATPSLWRMLLDSSWQGSARFKALVGGEALGVDLARALLDRAVDVWNLYGPTETTVWSTACRVDRAALAQRGVSIGRPIANTSVWVLDDALGLLPQGVAGELCIGGDGVALGYLDRPELNADRFVTFQPPAQADGSASAAIRLYRTGDRGRWRNDGLLEHLGRLDRQVKVRGYRIELGEIEAGCAAFAGVQRVVVAAREDRPGDVRLVAYLCLAPGVRLDTPSLRDHLKRRLPDYMLPQHVVVLDAIPLLPNGKVDHKGLPAPDAGTAAAPRAHVAPADALEAQVLTSIEAVLNLPGVSADDDFFALGGHSLLAARLTSRLNRELGLSLPLRTVFEAPTVQRLSKAIVVARSAGLGARAPIVHDPARRTAPLTPAQQRVRFVMALHPDHLGYNTPSAHRLSGPLDLAAFEAAFRAMVRRQPTLRTAIVADANGGFEQSIADDVDFAFPVEDLRALTPADREREMLARMQEIVDTPFDVARTPLFRTALYRLADDEHAFLFMPHHIVFDGWSFDVLYAEMSSIYGALKQGATPELPPLPVTYGDFSAWYAQWLLTPECMTQLAYWKQRFASVPSPRALGTDRPRQAGMSGVGATEWVHVDGPLAEALRALARRADLTLNMLLLTVYAAMMAELAKSRSIVVGMPVRGRPAAELEPVMGYFGNLLPMPLQFDGQQPVLDAARDVKRHMLDAMAHQEVPFERLALEPEVASRSQRVGIYQALFSFQDARERVRDWGGAQQKAILLFQRGATEDIGLWLMEVPGGLEGGIIYNADLYDASTAVALRERYLELLGKLLRAPDATLAALLDTAGSAPAAHLARLSTDPAAPAAVPAPPAPAAGAAKPAVQDTGFTTEEALLAGVWAEVLRIDVSMLRPQDNFFDVGGDSLLAMQAVEQAARVMGFQAEARRYVFESLSQLAVPAFAAAVQPSTERRGLLGRALSGLFRKSSK